MGTQILELCGKRASKQASQKCSETVSEKASVFAPCKKQNCVRGLQNYMFPGFTNSHRNDSPKPSFWHPFWIQDPPKGGKCRHKNITLKRLPKKYRKRTNLMSSIDGFFYANCVFISTLCLGKLDLAKRGGR